MPCLDGRAGANLVQQAFNLTEFITVRWGLCPMKDGQQRGVLFFRGGLLVLTAGMLSVALAPSPGADSAVLPAEDLTAWKHSKSVEIKGAGWKSDETDYPIMIRCHRGKGSDSAENVFLGDAARDDFGDVRFSDGTGQPFSYWMEESVPGKTAQFWVKVPRIPRDGLTKVRLHYGNAGAATASDGKKTFPFFDDFLGDYQGKWHAKVPPGWTSTYQDGKNCEWIVKDSVIRLRGSGHLTTVDKVWPNPAVAPCTLRARAAWPDPAFKNPGENGESFGGVSWPATDGNAWMVLFALYQSHRKISASFGSMPSDPEGEKKGASYIAAHNQKYELVEFKKADRGAFHTFEIERRPDETIGRVLDTGEEVRSKRVIPGALHLMIHGCQFDFPNSPYLSVDWMLLRKQAYPNPSYGSWN
jgi:hypothetical protein